MTRTLWIVGLTTALLPSFVAAQSSRVLVLPVSAGDSVPASAVDATREALLTDSRGVVPISDGAARERFEVAHSRPAVVVSVAEADRWTSLAREIVRHLANQEYEGARAAQREADLFAARAASELNRDATRARQVLDACLYGVRALLETRAAGADARAVECRRLVPRVAPSRYQHPPEVITLFDEATARARQSRGTQLRVESEPSGCAVRVQGVELGRTPLATEELIAGRYDVEVACDEARGRVHRVDLDHGPELLSVSAAFERSVRTQPGIGLVYESSELVESRRVADALTVAEVVGADQVWLVRREREALRLERLDVATRSIVEHGSASTSDVASVVRRTRAADDAAALAMPTERDEGEPARPADPTSAILGAITGVLGVAAYVGAWVLYDHRIGMSTRLENSHPGDDDYESSRTEWLDARYGIWALASAGGIFGIGATALLMPAEPDVPWWSWLIGGAGLGVVTVGVVELATARLCPDDTDHDAFCVRQAAPVDRGAIFIGMGAPLVAVPLIHLVREATRSRATVMIDVSPERAMAHVGGDF